MSIRKKLREKAKQLNGKIVLAESTDERILKAAEFMLESKMADICLIGDPEEVNHTANNYDCDISGAEIINPENHEKIEEFAEYLYNKRKNKGLTYAKAVSLVQNPLYFGAFLVKNKFVDGMVAGAVYTTADVLRSALHTVGVSSNIKTVSSSFLMVIPNFYGEDKIFFFADSAVIPNPDPAQLADIAISTANTRKKLLNDEPVVALLSFSTKGSAKHELVEKVVDAVEILKTRNPDFLFDGELQLDAAIIPEIGSLKAHGSKVAGKANVLIFPDLQSGNIGYKLVQRFANAQAIGPVLQGLACPICDLSRGCSFEDVINTTALVLLMSDKNKC